MEDYQFGHCRVEEIPELVALTNRVFRPGATGDMGREYPILFDPGNAVNLRVAWCGGRVVSHVGISIREAAIMGARLRVASIGAVATDPEHRGRELASRLMEDARRRALEEGCSLMLISGGRGLYHRLGYVEVGRFLAVTVPAGAAAGEWEVRPAGEGDLPALIALHQAEPVRFLRPREDWRRALAAGMLMNRASDLLCIARGGAVVAYAGLQSALRGTRKPIPVCEIAGSRGALAAALPGIAAGYGAPAVDVRTLAEDHALRAEASRRGWTVTGAAFPGTLGIIDPGRFFEATRPLLEERVGSALTVEAAGAGARLSAGPAAAAVGTMGALTALVFGGDTPEARAAPALPPALQQVVDAAFPLPLLWYGYNYV